MPNLLENEEKLLSVSEYNSLLNNLLSDLILKVVGEVTELNIWQNKFTYMTLKDTDVDTVTTSVFGMTMKTPNIFKIKVGDIVKIEGYPGVHSKSGRQSLQIEKIEKVEEGYYVQKREELIHKLTEEGLIDPSKKRRIVRKENRIALITAIPSQAYNDFVKIYNSRWGQGILDIYKSQMQGKDSYKFIIKSLEKAYNANFKYDCIVVARGGGSKEDLISFDNEDLVRKLFSSPYPTVSAIGHEGDISIMDMVADLRASTPSNAAELITTPDKNYYIQNSNNIVEDIYEKILGSLESKIDLANRSLENSIYLVGNNIKNFESKLENKSRLLDAYDLNNTLKRGFSIITAEDDFPIDSHENIKNDNIYNIYLKNGKSKKYSIKQPK